MNPPNPTQHRVPNTAPTAPTATPTVVVVDSGSTLSVCCGAYTSCDQYGEELLQGVLWESATMNQTQTASPILESCGIANVVTRDVLQRVSSNDIRVWAVQTITFTDGRVIEQNLWFDAAGRFHHAS